MKLKYYLKGLGTGILFASVILSISFAVYDRQNDKKTKDSIIAAALEAGMVWPEETSPNEATTPDDSSTDELPPEASTPNESTPEVTTPEKTTTEEPTIPEETTTAAPETTPEETTTVPEPTTPEETTGKEPQTTVNKDLDACILYKDDSRVKIQILKGMNSYDVAKILEKAGVLKGFADREAFNDYLVASGYSGLILVGIFEIPVGATYDEIINIVCSR